jgi:hypothetical protein
LAEAEFCHGGALLVLRCSYHPTGRGGMERGKGRAGQELSPEGGVSGRRGPLSQELERAGIDEPAPGG